MEMLGFFARVLPRGGRKLLAELVTYKDKTSGAELKGFRYYDYPSIQMMAEAAAEFDEQKRHIYHACAGFGDWYEETVKGKLKRRIRTQKNVVSYRSLFFDFDCGEGKDYPTKKAALADLKRFLQATGLPTPLVIDSGGGIHTYWTPSDDIDQQTWETLSALKRAAAKHLNLKFDTAVDMDSSRVLRPVGTHNRKYAEPRLVSAKNDPGFIGIDDFRATLQAYMDANDLVPNTPRSFKPLIDNSDLATTIEYPEAMADVVASHCAQIKFFKETGCDSEPLWWAAQGVVKHCVDGQEKVHEYSAMYDGYHTDECQQKMDNWTYGPTLCDKFKELAGDRCAGCPHSVKSPIQLGYVEPSQLPEPVAQPSADATEDENPLVVDSELASAMEHMPEGFAFRKGGVCAYVPDESGVMTVQLIAFPKFYPTYSLCLEDGTYALRMRVEYRPGKWGEFDFPAKYLAEGKALASNLAAYRITVKQPKATMDWLQKMQHSHVQLAEDVNTFKQFGWIPSRGGFLIGNRLIAADETKSVRISDEAVSDAIHNLFQVKGTKEVWVDGVDALFTRPNAEPYQYVIATVFGSPLVGLMDYDQWNGIPLALTSDTSGYGKTTVAQIAINALYKCYLGQISDSTPKGVLTRASNMNNVVTLYDEVTKWLAGNVEEMGSVLYALSNGKGRIRLKSDGTEAKQPPPFKGNNLITGNRNIMHQLTESKQNPEALQMRVLEVDLQDYPMVDTLHPDNPEHARFQAIANDLVNNNYGVLAEEYIGYIIKHKEALKLELGTMVTKLMERFMGNGVKERFYIYHIACSIVGLKVAKKLGYVKFEVTDVLRWIVRHVTKMREKASEMNLSALDKLALMLAEHHGQIIVTREFANRAGRNWKNPEHPILPLRGAPVARLVLRSDTERGRFFITVDAMDKWCSKNGISPLQFRRELAAARVIRQSLDKGGGADFVSRQALGKDVAGITMGRPRCVELDYSVVQGYVDDFVEGRTDSNVVSLPVADAVAEETGTA